MKNRALRTEPRYEPATVIPVKREQSLLEWLEANNRIIYREDSLNDTTSGVVEETRDIDSKELSDFIEDESDFELDDRAIEEEI
ncbi:MAG: DUF3134 family protein [Prochloraceae cyanobacterium]|nr:DUF3134 family protein [Prochloraceae cyanobacterium]